MRRRNNLDFISPNDIRKGQGLTHMLMDMPDSQTLLVGGEVEAPGALWVDYTDRPDYRDGRTDSIQQVQFADLTINTQENRRLATQPVAIKLYSEEALAAHDFHLAHTLNTDGKITFEPLGFTKINGKVAGLTRFEQGVTSFDNILWNTEAAPQLH